MPSRDLTIKQENFCQKYVECSNASEAYRYAYNAKNCKPETIWKRAYELMDLDWIKERIQELQAEHRAKHDVTVESVTKMIKEAYELAKDKKDVTNIRGSGMDLAKLHGLIVDKKVIQGEIDINKKRGDIAKRFAKRLLKDEE